MAISEWGTGQVLEFFRTGGRISASEFNVMDADTRTAFRILFEKTESDRLAESLTVAFAQAVEVAEQKDPVDSHNPPASDDAGFPMKLGEEST
ncbi:MAG: hypothetical protein DRH30_00920 [Deltaproteobacteria bacterium]|nr:MAG: hypothetical protein DRH30_00920 [Deltaproteobacteria bacterium]